MLSMTEHEQKEDFLLYAKQYFQPLSSLIKDGMI
jgi:hypothetical protein